MATKLSFVALPNARLGIAVALVLTLAASARAEESVPLPPPEFGIDNPPFTLTYKPVPGFRLGNFPIVLEQTTLSQVLAATGIGRIFEKGDAGDHILWLCYTVDDRKGSQRIWIVSGGEMGGPEHDILSVTAVTIPANSPTRQSCPALAWRFHPLLLDHNIRLGMNRTEVLDRLGKPSAAKGNLLSFAYNAPVDAGDPVFGLKQRELAQYTITNTLDLRIQGGHVTGLIAARATSN